MDILWGDHPDKPEDADEYSVEKLTACEGDVILVSPPFKAKYPKFKPKGKVIELRPGLKFRSNQPELWTNFRVRSTVGVITGLDVNLSLQLAQLALGGRFVKLEVAGNIAFINGPNLNLLGTRETKIYGSKTLDQIFQDCRVLAPNCQFVFRQSNSEGEIVNLIQKLRNESDAIIINAAGYTHTSVAIHDALRAYDDQIIELHLSNPHQRETFRRTNYISSTADSVISGFGSAGYKLALTAACMRL